MALHDHKILHGGSIPATGVVQTQAHSDSPPPLIQKSIQISVSGHKLLDWIPRSRENCMSDCQKWHGVHGCSYPCYHILLTLQMARYLSRQCPLTNTPCLICRSIFNRVNMGDWSPCRKLVYWIRKQGAKRGGASACAHSSCYQPPSSAAGSCWHRTIMATSTHPSTSGINFSVIMLKSAR